MFKDCQGIPYPVYAEGCVSTCKVVKEAVPANSVYELVVLLGTDAQEPAAGQFYMLHKICKQVEFTKRQLDRLAVFFDSA